MRMATIDGSVRDVAHAQEIVAVVTPLLLPGAVLRVTPKLVKVDMSRVREYDKSVAAGGESSLPQSTLQTP